MGSTGPLDNTNMQLTGGLVKPVRLLKKLAAVAAAGLLALGIVAGTASAASAGSGEISSADGSGEISGGSGEISVFGSGEIS